MKIRNRKGQFDKDRRLYKYFMIVFGVYAVSMIGINTLWGWAKSLEKTLLVENSQAIEVFQPTWQDEVKAMIRNAGLDVELASRIIQHESWWDPNNTHINKDGTRDRGLWMFHEVFHAEVSDECAYDPICATIHAIRVVKERGWDEWVAYQYIK